MNYELRNANCFKALAVLLAIFSSTAAMGQELAAAQISESSNSQEHTMLRKAVGEKAPEWIKDISDRINLHGYAQAGYTYSHKGGQNTNTFDLKRVLFWAEAKITDRWSFLFMHDFSSVVQEYYTDYRFTRNNALTVRFGQFKNGLSLENPLSPTAMEAIDVYSEAVTFLTGCGSDPLLGVQYGRDLGLALYGETNDGKFHYELDVLNGQGINTGDKNGHKDFIGSLQFQPIKDLFIGIFGWTGDYVDNTGVEIDRNRWAASVKYEHNDWTVRAEYAHAQGILANYQGEGKADGWYATVGVPCTPWLKVYGKYDAYRADKTWGSTKTIYSIIPNFQIHKNLMMQLQYNHVHNRNLVHKDYNELWAELYVRF